MSIRNLRVNPKDYKLNVSDEVLKNMSPYFEVSSRAMSSSHMEKELSHGQSKKTGGHEGKSIIDVRLRDSRTGELLGKGHVEHDENAMKSDKYEEKVDLKDVFGNKVGEATLEVEMKKGQPSSIETDFRKMRREISHMMRETNRIFENFSKRYSGRDYGFGLLDEFRPMLMFDDPWMREEMGSLGYGGGSSDQGKIDVEQSTGSTTGQKSMGQQSTGSKMGGNIGSSMSSQTGNMSPSQQKMQGGEKMQMEGKQGMQQGMQQQGMKKGMETEKPTKA